MNPCQWRISTGLLKALLVCLGLSLPIMNVTASSLRQVGLEEMANVCEFIFEGRVVGQQVQTGPTGDIHTVVNFEVLEVIKGDYQKPVVELQFLGGSLGGRSMKVTDMHLPQVGEQGIYFVESLEKDLINPLCAWDQGHFIVERDLGMDADVVKTSKRRPIYGIDLDGPTAGQRKELSRGIASGIRLKHTPDEQPLTTRNFKQQVRDLVSEVQQ